jgi:hypothetical protein
MRNAPALLLLLAAGAAGCGVEEDPRPESLRYIQQAILKPSCATAACHSSLNHRAGFVFDDPETIYEMVYSVGVQPGDSGDSALIGLYLTGDDPELRMPLDAPLPDADIALIARWIDEGAEDN